MATTASNGRLMRIDTWRKTRFVPEDIPARTTVMRWIAKGEVPAKQIGRQWYIDVEEEQKSTGDELVDQVLRG